MIEKGGRKMKIFEEARGYIKDRRYKIISPTMMDVGKNNVTLQIKKGRSELLCSCTGSSRFADNNLCAHKIVFINVNFNDNLYSEIDKAIFDVKKYKELNFEMSNSLCLDILEKIRRAE